MEENKPPSVKVKFEDPNILHDFFIIISPDDGYWQGGRFKFHVKVIDANIFSYLNYQIFILRFHQNTTWCHQTWYA